MDKIRNGSGRCKSRQASHSFVGRLSDKAMCEHFSSEDTKQELLDFLNWNFKVVEFCIAREKSAEKGKFHLQFYFMSEEGLNLTELGDVLRDSFMESNVDIQSCKSRRNALKYLSKEDFKLLTNVKVSSLSFSYQLYCHYFEVKEFDITHPFVLLHNNKYRFIEQYFVGMQKAAIPPFYGFSQHVECYCCWTERVSRWWNDWVVSGWSFKKKQLYLWGDADVGKTSYCQRLFTDIDKALIFQPTPGKFGFEGLQSYHKLIFVNDYRPGEYDDMVLKNILEGSSIFVSVKCKGAVRKQFRGPVIFTSNYDLEDSALRARFQIVEADSSYYLFTEYLIQKNGLPEVYEIPSSEDEEETTEKAWSQDGQTWSQVTN